jgi:hypothetical protein
MYSYLYSYIYIYTNIQINYANDHSIKEFLEPLYQWETYSRPVIFRLESSSKITMYIRRIL